MVAAETKMVKSSTYRVRCTSDPSCFVISLMAIAKRVNQSEEDVLDYDRLQKACTKSLQNIGARDQH